MARKASRKRTAARGTAKKATAAKRSGSARTATAAKKPRGTASASTRKSGTGRKSAGARRAPSPKAEAARKAQGSRTAKKVTKKGAAKTRATSTRKATTARARKTRTLDTPTARERNAARSSATRRRRQAPAPEPASRLAAAAALVRGAVSGAMTAVADTLSWSDPTLDALQLLEQDHRRFEDLLRQGEETTERARTTRRELLNTLTSELAAHELKEEKILYPALESHPESREIVLEGYEEHHVADAIITELHDVATDDEGWAAKFKVLKENLEHHIQEEEGEMFRLARGLFSKDELQELGERMRELTAKATR